VTLLDGSDADLEVAGVTCRLVDTRDGVWTLTSPEHGGDLGILRRKPDGSWEFRDMAGDRVRQGADWRPIVEHEVLGDGQTRATSAS
jgi:hypothetical protein